MIQWDVLHKKISTQEKIAYFSVQLITQTSHNDDSSKTILHKTFATGAEFSIANSMIK